MPHWNLLAQIENECAAGTERYYELIESVDAERVMPDACTSRDSILGK
jgi:hypothetical protein